MKITLLPAFLLVAGAAGAQPPTATDPARPGTAQVEVPFASWLGCWRLEDDVEGTGARVCITPDGPGVRLQTIMGGQLTADEALRGDGVARPIGEAGCQGTERSHWSKDNLRLFRYADVTCGTEGSRSVSGIVSFGPGPTWVSVEILGDGESRMVRVQRYRPALDQEPPDGTSGTQVVGQDAEWPAESWNVDDVIEASRRMPAEVVQAALTEARVPFALNKRSLIALADAGVPEDTIDVMIGVTYPDRFDVKRRGGWSSGGGIAASYDPFFYWGSSYDSCYAGAYGYHSYYYSTSCITEYYGNGYGHEPGNGDDWFPVPGPPVPTERQPHGRVVDGRGYTQVEPRDNGSSGGYGTGGWAGGGSRDSSGGTSSVSSSGYSSGGAPAGSSGGDTGDRVAVPRTPDNR